MASGWLNYAGYSNCPYIENDKTRVVLGPHMGGRVLEYAYRGENVLMLDPRQNGWTYTPGERQRLGPSGGRFDVGPEHTQTRHPDLWFGAWTAEVTGENTAKMTSVADKASGLQLEREFVLAPDSTQLACTQTIHNISNREIKCCHWSRTFGLGHGICVVPLSSYSRFPRKYIMYGPGPAMNFMPEDPHIRVDDDFLVIDDIPERPKLGLDTYEGWFAYLETNDLMLVKQYATYPDRVYNEMAGITLSLWYMRDFVCELEPIGPMEILAPGESVNFTENWTILEFPFPELRDQVDPHAVKSAVKSILT
jgi:hypothetical protein